MLHKFHTAILTFSLIAAISLSFYSENTTNFFTKASSSKAKTIVILVDAQTESPIDMYTVDTIEISNSEEVIGIEIVHLTLNDISYDPQLITQFDIDYTLDELASNTTYYKKYKKYFFTLQASDFKRIRNLSFVTENGEEYPLDVLDIAISKNN